MRRLLLLGLLVLLLGALFRGAPARAGGATIRVGDRFDPATLRIRPGTAVTWESVDGERHRVRSTSGPTEFDGDMDPGESFTYTFEVGGTWEYRDKRNDDDDYYFGTVIVEPGAPGPAPDAEPESAPPASAGSVTIAGRAFSPASITVARGGTVTWSNRDDDAHTVTASGAFGSGTLRTGASFSHTFPEAGTFRYVCEFHSEMRGTVTVVAPNPGPATATPPAPDGATPAEPDTTTSTTTTTTRKGSLRPAAGQETTAAGSGRDRSRSTGPGALVLAAAGGVAVGAGAPPLYRHWRRRSRA